MRDNCTGPVEALSAGTTMDARDCSCHDTLAGDAAVAEAANTTSSTTSTAPTGGPPGKLSATKPRVYDAARADAAYAAVRLSAAKPSTERPVTTVVLFTKAVMLLIACAWETPSKSMVLWPRVLRR